MEQYKDGLCRSDDGRGHHNRDVCESGNRQMVHGCGDVAGEVFVENEGNFKFTFYWKMLTDKI